MATRSKKVEKKGVATSTSKRTANKRPASKGASAARSKKVAVSRSKPKLSPSRRTLLKDRHLPDQFDPFADLVAASSKPRRSQPNFYARVYAVVEQIPRGKVTTYGAIAETLGMKRSARMVGQALTALPVCDIPAHRVINRIGALTGAIHFGGYERMRSLLTREGITFKQELVHMEKHFWDPRVAENH